jgi:hypothetical protein
MVQISFEMSVSQKVEECSLRNYMRLVDTPP